MRKARPDGPACASPDRHGGSGVRRIASIGALIAACTAVAAFAAAPAAAAHDAAFGVQDDAWLLYGPGTFDQRVGTLQKLGVGIVRVTLDWSQIAPTKPADPRNPYDTAYHWNAFDLALTALHDHGIPALVTIWGSPPWANGGHGPNWLPTSGFGNFAYAAAQRFPWVRLWTVWNEPNSRTSSIPVSPKLYVRRLLTPAYRLLHLANPANQVAGGVTSPRKPPSGMSPLAFMQGLHRYHAKLDAYAHNPYPGSRKETPFFDPCTWCRTLTMARLPEIRADVTKYFGDVPLWLTEYGYQTDPPDPLFGVSPALQATYESEAALRVWQQPGVTVLIHFLIRDEPALGGWQSGFFTVRGKAKPAFRSFALPLAQISRHGVRTVLWGQVRPGQGRRTYVLERWTGHGWARIGGSHRTNLAGTFERVIRGVPGEKVRLRSPATGYAGPPLAIS